MGRRSSSIAKGRGIKRTYSPSTERSRKKGRGGGRKRGWKKEITASDASESSASSPGLGGGGREKNKEGDSPLQRFSEYTRIEETGAQNKAASSR